jgi:two-component system CheB/CheR fusion protein
MAPSAWSIIKPNQSCRNQATLLAPVLIFRDITETRKTEMEIERRYRDGITLTRTNRALVGALEFEQMTGVVCRAVRELTGADGATLVLREGDRCAMPRKTGSLRCGRAAISRLTSAFSGWAMQHQEVAIVEDVHADPRLQHALYGPTFVNSLAMIPVGTGHSRCIDRCLLGRTPS